MKNNILSVLKCARPDCDFENSSDYIDDGYLDSFDIILIISELDKLFDISILGEDIIPENFSSVEDLSKLVSKYLAAKNDSA
jgi:acyl carrier protein